ncbi:ATP-dependent RNA helicase DHX8 [Tricladium varicosporioides]|nr:ATP-dependent RNA helicase DHX8 [Hymenoscyphus varicosporioides]
MASTTSTTPTTPYRQIRAVYDEKTITVYQAYQESIAVAAVASQKLSASPDFRYNRMTWIKPSWCWMMYRSGYAQKDARQTRILAIKMTHENFQELLMQAAICHHALSSDDREKPVRVQWDPERSPRIGVLPYRSIQIGIGRAWSEKWAEGMTEGIEDVTEKALKLKEWLNENREVDVNKEEGLKRLIELGLMPEERVYEVPGELRKILQMDLE